MTLPEIKVYNTLTRTLERFEPFEPGLVKMYICGPTVYDYSHIGHARTYIAYDAIKKYLMLRGYNVIHVQNITDIDDKIINRAIEEGKDWKEIAETYSKDYLEALEKLNVHPHIHPRVTHHVTDIIEFIQMMVNKGIAYESNGSVYFDVTKYSDYGRLSKRLSKEAWRQENEVLKEKRNPFDFALWKRAKENEPYWESPWGPGRPGWHIECSVMSTKYLGTRIDIHGGGSDLIFPHHENERAQSEAALEVKPWVKYWMHTGMLTVKGEKMSKSLGNTVYLKDILAKHDPSIIRLWVLSAHYRTQLEFNDEKLIQIKRNLERLQQVYTEVTRLINEAETDHRLEDNEIKTLYEIAGLHKEFHEAMSDDFNTSLAFSIYYQATNIFYKKILDKPRKALLIALKNFMEEADYVFNILPRQRVGEKDYETIKELLDIIIYIRNILRERKEYDLADLIRSRLAELDIILMDQGKETKYIIKK